MSDTNKENIRGNGDSINMSGNFGSGFSKGEINIDQN